jgi:CMP-N,N'-diacetyllegionaminic acid synthase
MPTPPIVSSRGLPHGGSAIGLVTARGGSKGLPGKNLTTLGGKPLIAWTLEAARKARSLDRVIVSTDDPKIAETARQFGGEVPFLRPPELARDDSPHVDVVLHALSWLDEHEDDRPDYVVLLQPTSPFRTAEDIDAAVALAVGKRADAVVSVCEAHDHPYLTRKLSAGGTLEEFFPCPIKYARRQDLPPAYALNGAIYVSRRESFFASRNLCPSGALAHLMPNERSLEIDTPWELRIANLIMSDRSIRI